MIIIIKFLNFKKNKINKTYTFLEHEDGGHFFEPSGTAGLCLEPFFGCVVYHVTYVGI